MGSVRRRGGKPVVGLEDPEQHPASIGGQQHRTGL